MTIPVGPAADPGLGKAMVTVASYPDYEAAQRAVDFLSDNKFPVEHTAIVGTGLSLVENVLGRMTTGKAALAGLASGAWFGLFIGLLLSIFTPRHWLAPILTGLLIGAVWGAIFGAIAHAATRGRRDFTSRSSLQATEYAVSVETGHAEQARQLLTKLNWQASGAQ
ncbi:general stress protein [Catelliglobosispora koreensis]|uniref:general stress protein n=1 Tax=Catelliglobosispora koreensis TaxID=129052 RepID=UPI000369CD84|nr:general stress protein [Catelliglobosispora koreensis]